MANNVPNRTNQKHKATYSLQIAHPRSMKHILAWQVLLGSTNYHFFFKAVCSNVVCLPWVCAAPTGRCSGDYSTLAHPAQADTHHCPARRCPTGCHTWEMSVYTEALPLGCQNYWFDHNYLILLSKISKKALCPGNARFSLCQDIYLCEQKYWDMPLN